MMQMVLTGVPPEGALGNMEEVIFDAKFYNDKYPDLQNAFHGDAGKLHKHWHEFGIKEGRACSAVYDGKFYLDHHPDLQNAFGATNYERVYKHYFEFGINEQRQSSPLFDPKVYKACYPWLSNLTPRQLIWHFKNQGYPQGLIATMGFAAIPVGPMTIGNPEELIFDAKFYNDKYPDLQNAFHGDAAKLHKHWHEFGIKEGRACSDVFDGQFYLSKYPDLQQAFGATNYERAYKHFFEFGLKEMRQSSPVYDPKIYQARYGLAGLNPQQLMHHFLTYGRFHYMWAY